VEKKKQVVVVGLGEVGRPLLQLASEQYQSVGVDIASPQEWIGHADVLHVCYPFSIKDFVGETARYVERFKPELTIINSTVAVGTTRAIAERTGAAVVNSPVRGKHARMLEDLRCYVKFIGPMDPSSGQAAAAHFQALGLKTKVLSSPEATELAKLTETTYFGLLIAWAQEAERYCDQFNEAYDEVASFWEEIKYLPPVTYFPGTIGGHCVMPNIEILSKFVHSPILKAIQDSNQRKMEREGRRGQKPSTVNDKQVSGTGTLASSSPSPTTRPQTTLVGS
jgi:UDP-N-acetyl-D-mannosaminuronate dehydrogenase